MSFHEVFAMHSCKHYSYIFGRTTIRIKEGKEDKLLFQCVSDNVQMYVCTNDCQCVYKMGKSILSRARNYTTYIQQFIHSSRYHNVVMKSSYRYVRRKKRKPKNSKNSPSPSVSCSAVLFSTFVVGDVTCPQYHRSRILPFYL